MEELISVIIPIYNVERYLERCINSIINQTYSNLEIILVDDGSTDKCPEICDSFLKKDSRIKVIHKKNGGLSDARNLGIDIAQGDYIGFVDSDDFIHPKMYEILYNNMILENADLSICSFQKVYNSEIIDITSNNIFCVNSKDAYYYLYNNYGITTVVAWNKLYKKNLFSKIRYPLGKLNEDEFIIHHILGLCSKLVYTDAKLLFYFQRENSIMATYNIKRLDVFEALQDRMFYFNEKKLPQLYALTLKLYILNLCLHLVMMKKSKLQNKEIKERVKKQLYEKYKESRKNKLLIWKDHFKLWFAYRNKSIFYMIVNLKERS